MECRNAVRHCENERKEAFLNYKAALPAERAFEVVDATLTLSASIMADLCR